ncbi:di-heme oxidoreductase family protein [Ketobacter nezhaii]|uniref:di-heme oxidoreductase family protein n=1 Tax=Ketobacter sp. MCCC 1A13808 TaxID=2602738 RepID=UPI0018DB94F5|nr:di-heme oxidoredictase family protein [Ketobacter sp. MCCC 1A13808]
MLSMTMPLVAIRLSPTQPATNMPLSARPEYFSHTNKPGKSRLVFVYFVFFLWLSGCNHEAIAKMPVPPIDPAEILPGGNTSVSITPFASFEKPAQNLPHDQKPDFHAGKALANQPWIKAPTSTTSRDGLGPVYNARTCLACHINGGKGAVPDNNQQRLFSAFLRISVPGTNSTLGVQPEPTYGDQLQTQSVSLAHQLGQITEENSQSNGVKPEAYVYLNWVESSFTYSDNHTVTLRYPEPEIRQLQYGPLQKNTLFSLRVAPAIPGMGLIELIEQSDIEKLADPHDRNQDGISGRINRVWDARSQKTVPGRFGMKANRPDVAMVVAAAFANDVGISNRLFPDQPCTTKQTRCLDEPSGNDDTGIEIADPLFGLVVGFTQNLAVPVRRNADDKWVQQGRSLFYETGCSGCHHPRYVTGRSTKNPHLSEQTIWPYSDFLLHDMGPGLADGRPDFEASGNEWRTPPLWGIGLTKAVNGNANLLHDGRARSVEEAILWHGGEAGPAQQAFIDLPEQQRELLIQFVESL